MKVKFIFFIAILIVLIVTLINPKFPNEQFLQHAGTMLLLIPLIFDLRKNKLGKLTFGFYSLFVTLHIIGARYIYSFVPYNDWSIYLFNKDLNFIFDFERNHFDRLVHFSFGLLWFPFLFHLTNKITNLNINQKLIFALMILQLISLGYELFEWLLTLIMSENGANNYNGQQGDMWDAHKDISLAFLGSLISFLIVKYKLKFQKIV